MIKELKCPNCGGALTHQGWGKYKCEYCNSTFENKDEFGNVHIIERERPRIVTLAAKSIIPDDIFYHYQKNGNTEAFYAQVKHELAYQLAEGLTKYLEITYIPFLTIFLLIFTISFPYTQAFISLPSQSLNINIKYL